MCSFNVGFAGATSQRPAWSLKGRSFNHSAMRSLLQASLLRVSFRNLLLVGDWGDDSIGCLVGEGKRSRYILSSGREPESGEPLPKLESEEARPRPDVSTLIFASGYTRELSRSSTNFEEVMLVGYWKELTRKKSLDQRATTLELLETR
jgi:hypothetical protein